MTTKINEISIIPIQSTNGLVGFASFVFDNSFYIGSIAIYTRPLGGYRLLYPTKKIDNKNIATIYPISKEVGQLIEDVIVKKFEDVTKNDRYRRSSI